MSATPIKLSVIIPVYNTEEYLVKCLDSVTGQTLEDIEILVIDDGSRDDSWKIIKSFASKDRRIVAIRHRNRGVSATRNVGINKARGEFVGFVDADDYIDPRYFESLIDAATGTGADIASGYVATSDTGRQRFYNYTNKRSVARNKAELKGVVWLNVYKRSVLEINKIRFLSKLRTAEDNLFNLQASHYANKIESSEDEGVFYHHVTHDGSLMAQQHSRSSLLMLTISVYETVKLLNTMHGYDEDTYINRVIDTVHFLYVRFTESDPLTVLTRFKISIIFMRIWRIVQYRSRLLDAVSEKEIDLRKLIYGRVAGRLYEKHVVEYTDKKVQPVRAKISTMGIIKKAVKAILPHGFIVLYKRRIELMSKASVSGNKGLLNARKVAVIVPFQNVKYAELVKDAVKIAGYEVSEGPSDARYIWLHWYENGINNYSDFLDKLTAIKVWKDQGRKVIVHVHNKRPHESPAPHVSHALMVSLIDTADQVSIMSTETKNVLKDMWFFRDDFSRTSTVPHPNYIGAYGEKIKPSDALKNDTLKILFFGLVRPYKGIEHLIEATQNMENVEVSIFGKPKDDAYVAKIQEMCSDRDNIKFRLEHIPDEDIPPIFSEHHLVALPYSINSSLNSGAAILALSYARTIVGTNNGTLKDLESQELYYGYSYADEADHIIKLRNKIRDIQEQFDGKYNELINVGERAFTSVEKNNSIEVVARSISEMIKRLG
jgi:beta-1,4-mannosyltransferase